MASDEDRNSMQTLAGNAAAAAILITRAAGAQAAPVSALPPETPAITVAATHDTEPKPTMVDRYAKKEELPDQWPTRS